MELFFDMLRSIVYGVIEGITEWLPISSTGHMILAEQVLKFSLSAEFMKMFRVVIQLGAILAVVVLYFKKLWPFCGDNGRDSGLAKHIRWPVMRLWGKIIVACLPAAVLGLADHKGMLAPGYDADVVAGSGLYGYDVALFEGNFVAVAVVTFAGVLELHFYVLAFFGIAGNVG